MKVVDIATEIFEELGQPSSLSLPAISFWVRNNVGSLNNYINTSFSVREADFEVVRTVDNSVIEIDQNAKAVLKKMYMVHYYDQQIRTQLASSDNVTEVSQDGMTVRKVNKGEIVRHLSTIKKQEDEELKFLINAYKTNEAAPRQVAGDDIKEATWYSDSVGTDAEKFRKNNNLL